MPMRFTWFNLMPWPYLPDDFRQRYRSVWVDLPNKLYDPVKGHALYHEPIAVLVVLVDAEPVEAEGLGVLELVHVLVVQRVALDRVIQLVGQIHPDRTIALPKVIGQIRPRHQVEPRKAHRHAPRLHCPPMTTIDVGAPPLQFVDLHGYRMAYREWGLAEHTEAVLLIHGITSSSLSWIRVAPQLAESARVIAVDLKGHGDSDRPASGYRLSDQADEITGLVEALGLRSIRLMGHSWGGAISAIIAARNSLPITRVVLEDPAIAVSGGPPERRRQTEQNYVASVGLGPAEAEQRVR